MADEIINGQIVSGSMSKCAWAAEMESYRAACLLVAL